MPGLAEYHATLKGSHRHYAWKMGFRALLVAIDIALVGMVAWIIDSLNADNSGFFDFWDDWIIAFDLIPIGISFIFCIVVIAYQLLRKRPVHPGWDVGTDLLLWLAFAVMAGFTIATAIYYFDGYYDDSYDYNGSDSGGYYITAANGTEVYVPPGSDGQCPAFNSCAEQQAFYASLRHRGIVEMAIFALMIVALILHFALFVWGCIDTAKHNRNTVNRDARTLAQSMISEMVANGQIPPPQQPLLFPGHSQRDSQAGSQMSREANQVPAGPAPPQPAHQPASYGYYAPEAAAAPPTQQQQGSWPLQDPAAGQPQQFNEKRALQANMPPPPRQSYMAPTTQPAPYAAPYIALAQEQRPQTQPVLDLPSPLSPIDLPARAESPTIPELGPTAAAAAGTGAGAARRHSSNSQRPTSVTPHYNNANSGHTPAVKHTAAGASASSDALDGGPMVPVRAPGHTASRRVSNASGTLRQSIAVQS